MPSRTANSREFRDLMGHFCTGVTVVTGLDADQPWGFTAQSFVALSLEPELVAVCPAKDSDSWPGIQRSGAFCVNFLKASQAALSNRFAQNGVEKFADTDWTTGVTGSPVLREAMAFVDCSLVREADAGDHTIAIGKVEDLGYLDAESGPLLFYRGRYRAIAPQAEDV